MALEAVREKEAKINELIEELGNKELLLSEAKQELESVRGGGVWRRRRWRWRWTAGCAVLV